MTTFPPDGSDDDYDFSNHLVPPVSGPHSKGYQAIQDGTESAGQSVPASLLSITLALLPSLLLRL